MLALGVIAGVAAAVWLLLDDGALPGSTDRRGAEVGTLTIESKAVGRSQPVSVVLPPEEGGKRPLLVFLHGRGGDEGTCLTDEVFAALADLGARAPVIACPDGGDSSYWHDRDTGDWGIYVVDEVIPAVAEDFDVDPNRVAIGGISMGGYGAYNLAIENPGRFCAVGGHSPALWASAGETAAGAFDDAADFEANDVVATASADPGPFTSQPVWLDTGDEDPFLPGDEAFVSALEAAGAPLTEKVWPGGHDSAYWAEHWDEYLRFYARALDDC